jgi:hypothetical protein
VTKEVVGVFVPFSCAASFTLLVTKVKAKVAIKVISNAENTDNLKSSKWISKQGVLQIPKLNSQCVLLGVVKYRGSVGT